MSKYKKLEIHAKKICNAIFLWEKKSIFWGSGLEFLDFRSYDKNNDDAKRIDRLVSAREWKTLVRRFHEQKDFDAKIVIETSESMDFSSQKMDIFLELIFVFVQALKKNSQNISIYLQEKHRLQEFSSKEKNYLYRFSKIFSQKKFLKKSETTFDLKNIQKIAKKASLIFLISDKTDRDYSQIKALSYKHEIIFINIFDHFENTLETKKNWIFGFRFFKKNIFIDSEEKQKIQDFQELRKRKISQIRKNLYSLWIDYLCIDTQTNLLISLLRFFKNRKI